MPVILQCSSPAVDNPRPPTKQSDFYLFPPCLSLARKIATAVKVLFWFFFISFFYTGRRITVTERYFWALQKQKVLCLIPNSLTPPVLLSITVF